MMLKELIQHLRASVMVLLLMTVLTGIAYPALITGLAQVLMGERANGSLIQKGNTVAGSEWVGQPFSDPRYFWGRPSATGPVPYNAAASSGSNQGPTNPALLDAVKGRVETLRAADPTNKAAVPVDLVTASGSGLDPHISPAAATYQLARVAKARGLEESAVKALVADATEPRQLGILGEPRVNVLKLNLALDENKAQR